MAKKSLGQNFLKNKKIIEDILRAGEVSKNDTILEIGPGHGELTEFLSKKAKKVIAIEKDRNLIPLLNDKFRDYKNVEIIHGDVLKIFNSKFSIFNQLKNSKIKNSIEIRNWKFKIVANIPYYITSRFLRQVLTSNSKPQLIVLMIQYEVAKRISAKAPEMNLLALSAQAYGKVEFIKKVSRGNFSPQPKVDSAIIKISDISDRFFRGNKIDEKKFFEILRQAFQQKRKMLRRSLGKMSDTECRTFGEKRPQELSLENWKEISI